MTFFRLLFPSNRLQGYLAAAFIMLLFPISADAQYEIDLDSIKNTGLQYVTIDTENGEMPTCECIPSPAGCVGQGITNMNKVKGRIRIMQNEQTLYDSGDYLEDVSGMIIRVRGNSSAWSAKKPYKIHLQRKADLLFRGDDYWDKDWLLIKDERTSLNTFIGLTVNKLLDLQWTPQFRYVNVILNNKYMGVYMLIESVKRNKDCRLNVDKETGYIFEYDPYWWNEELYFETAYTADSTAKFTFKYPDDIDISEQQIDYIRSVMDSIETDLTNNVFPENLDINSFASWVLGQDILGNWDGLGSNIYMTKYDNTEDSKIRMGNLWDFDMIMKQENKWASSHQTFYFKKLFGNENQTFITAYIKRWEEFSCRPYSQINEEIMRFVHSDYGEAYGRSIPFDNKRWGKSIVSLDEISQEAIDWFGSRKTWLNDNILKLATGIKPVRRETNNDAIFNLQGVRQRRPQRGFYIVIDEDGNPRKYIKK